MRASRYLWGLSFHWVWDKLHSFLQIWSEDNNYCLAPVPTWLWNSSVSDLRWVPGWGVKPSAVTMGNHRHPGPSPVPQRLGQEARSARPRQALSSSRQARAWLAKAAALSLSILDYGTPPHLTLPAPACPSQAGPNVLSSVSSQHFVPAAMKALPVSFKYISTSSRAIVEKICCCCCC